MSSIVAPNDEVLEQREALRCVVGLRVVEARGFELLGSDQVARRTRCSATR
jgi:hypothetical protein